MRGPATAPQKEVSGPRPPRPASENLIQARASPRAAGARGPRGAGQPMQGFNAHSLQSMVGKFNQTNLLLENH